MIEHCAQRLQIAVYGFCILVVFGLMLLASSSAAAQIIGPPPGSGIAGIKFEDKNENGIQDNQEQVLAGWEIVLIDKQTGKVTKTVTNEFGMYQFSDLLPGKYIIRENLRRGWLPTRPRSTVHRVRITTPELHVRNFGNIHVTDKVRNILIRKGLVQP